MVYIASDHAGYKLKHKLVRFLKNNDYSVEDMGPEKFDENDDYPDYVIPAIRKVQESAENKGILICKNGVGVAILANKLLGIRAGLSWNTKHARSQRTDDNTNVLTLPAGFIGTIKAEKIVKTWLETNFTAEERHIRRLEKVSLYDNPRNI